MYAGIYYLIGDTLPIQIIVTGELSKRGHPAFFAGIQIEFSEEAKYLEFKSEYMLGTKPMMIDVLIKRKKHKY